MSTLKNFRYDKRISMIFRVSKAGEAMRISAGSLEQAEERFAKIS